MANKATFSFSTKPFTGKSAGSKQKFKSSDFIYGRLEVPGTINDFFKIPKTSNKRDYPVDVLQYKVTVEKDGSRMGSNSWRDSKIDSEQRASNAWAFDILPEPKEATTMTCGLADYSSNVSAAPLYMMFTRSNFPDSGLYVIKIEIKYWKFDPYQPNFPLPEEEWITAAGEFEFEFDTDDLPTLQGNFAEAGDLVKENARAKALEARGLPREWHIKNAAIATGHQEEELGPLLLAKEAETCKLLKIVIHPVTGPRWIVEKNDVDIPTIKWHNQMFGFFCENNGRYFYISGGFRQEYEGGGTYGPVFFQWTERVELSGKFIKEAMAGEKGAKSAKAEKPAAKAKSKAKSR